MVEHKRRMGAAEMAAFVEGTKAVDFRAGPRAETYAWVEARLVEQEYARRTKPEKGQIRRYLGKVTGMSRAQVTRLIGRYRREGRVRARMGRRRRFPRTYTEADIGRLAAVDEAHGRLSGPATRRILAREWEVYQRPGFERLAGISVAHLYNLRRGEGYRRRSRHWEKTRSAAVQYGERRRPEPEGKPGHMRVDTVHQGDAADGTKGVYHINLVDAVTQWELVGSCGAISEAHLEPLLAQLIDELPFPLLGFHSDNGSEFVNQTVARLLDRLCARFTRSRANRSNDNALVEGKNGAVIRKLIGYGHIERRHAAAINEFYRRHLNPYLNFHRPCGFATVTCNERGKRRRRYLSQDYRTPYEKLRLLPGADTCLKPGVTWAQLDALALRQSDTEAALAMGQAKHRLFQTLAATPEGPWKSGNPKERDSHFSTAPTTAATPISQTKSKASAHAAGG